MPDARDDSQERIAALLHTARKSLDLSLAFLSRLDGPDQTLEVVDSAAWLPISDGVTQPRATSLCQVILDGDLPPVLPDLRSFPVAMALPAAKRPRLRSYISVPVRLSDGSLYGTFCAAGLTPRPELGKRDQGLMEVLAQAAALIIEPQVMAEQHARALAERFEPLMAAGGPAIVWQPIVDLGSGKFRAAEALSRFPAEWGAPPDVCFAEAHEIGVGHELELLSLLNAFRQSTQLPGYGTLNISPNTLVLESTTAALTEIASDKVVLELSEHDPVADYDALNAALGPMRDKGLRVAIDDVGSGFSSLRHVLLIHPDVLKLDRSMVSGVRPGTAQFDLIQSLADFGHRIGARIVAEGVEEQSEADALGSAGVDYGQGWLFGRPIPLPDLLSQSEHRGWESDEGVRVG